MDAAALSRLLTDSTTRLAQLHDRLGHPPDRLADSLRSLHRAIRTALDEQVRNAEREEAVARSGIAQARADILRYRGALEEPQNDDDAAGAASTSAASSSRRSHAESDDDEEAPLLPRLASLEAETSRLRATYRARSEQAARLHGEIAAYRPLLGEFVPVEASLPPPPPPSRLAAQAKAGSSTRAGAPRGRSSGASGTDVGRETGPDGKGGGGGDDDGGDEEEQRNLAALPSSYLEALSGALAACARELERRTEELRLHLLEVVQLWSELCLPPELGSPAPAKLDVTIRGEDGGDGDEDAGETLSFDARVLRHLGLRAVGLEAEEGWAGDFEVAETDVDSDGAGGAEQGRRGRRRGSSSSGGVGSSDDDGSAGEAAAGDETPTRSSGTHDALAPSHHRRGAPSRGRHVLAPTPANLSLASAKRAHLEREKQRRERRIQEVYDELVDLWLKFGVEHEEMDAFVAANAGSTLGVVEAYEGELAKMRELKSQHMSLFISHVRARIAAVWDEMLLSRDERASAFPNFFVDLALPADAPGSPAGAGAAATATAGVAAEATDELLAEHEAYESRARAERDARLPLLRMVERYRGLCQEERQLEESAKDTSRLLGRGRGVRGDPGRLLREEKMRKRVKALKPKLEEEMCRAIPAWEEEHQMPFTVEGARYLDELREKLPEAASKKRARTVSNSSSVASTPALGASGAHNRTSVASTPMRHGRGRSGLVTPSVTGGDGGGVVGTAAKRRKLASQQHQPPPPSSDGGSGGAGRERRTAPARTGAGVGSHGARATTSTSAQGRPPVSGLRAGAAAARPGPTTAGVGVASAHDKAGGSRIPMPSSPAKPAARGWHAAATVTAVPSRAAFRPRPSSVENAPPVRRDAVGGGGGRFKVPTLDGTAANPTTASSSSSSSSSSSGSRSASAHSVSSALSNAASDATTLVHPPARACAAPPPSSSSSGPAKRSAKRAPSISLQDTLAQLSRHGTAFTRPSESGAGATIRSVSSSSSAAAMGSGNGVGGGANWAVLDEDEELEEAGRQTRPVDEEDHEAERKDGRATPPWDRVGAPTSRVAVA